MGCFGSKIAVKDSPSLIAGEQTSEVHAIESFFPKQSEERKESGAAVFSLEGMIKDISTHSLELGSSFGSGLENRSHSEENLRNYEFLHVIGSGSFGKIRLAEHRETGEFYAVKEIDKKRLQKKQGFGRVNLIDSVYQEIAVMKKIKHPNIVELFEVFETSDKIFMILEYMELGSLMQLMEENQSHNKKHVGENNLVQMNFLPLPIADVWRYFRDVLRGIQYVHNSGVFHRDIKPENMLVGHAGELKISDFGVSCFFKSEDDADETINETQGSPAFLAPEVCRGDHIRNPEAVDLWAIGITLYLMSFGTVPFAAQNAIDLFEEIMSRDLYIPPNTDPLLENLLRLLLEKEPEDRIKMRELIKHPWVTDEGNEPWANLALDAFDVTPEDIAKAIKQDQQAYKNVKRRLSVLSPNDATRQRRASYVQPGLSPSASNSSAASNSLLPAQVRPVHVSMIDEGIYEEEETPGAINYAVDDYGDYLELDDSEPDDSFLDPYITYSNHNLNVDYKDVMHQEAHALFNVPSQQPKGQFAVDEYLAMCGEMNNQKSMSTLHSNSSRTVEEQFSDYEYDEIIEDDVPVNSMQNSYSNPVMGYGTRGYEDDIVAEQSLTDLVRDNNVDPNHIHSVVEMEVPTNLLEEAERNMQANNIDGFGFADYYVDTDGYDAYDIDSDLIPSDFLDSEEEEDF
ncbi:hypothetical protein PCE1_002696 [Barthelona sp. PCE]